MYGRRDHQPALLLVIFIALELILTFAHPLGWVSFGPVYAATLHHLPVVLAGVLLGPWAGALVGLIAGVSRVIDLAFLNVDALFTPMYSPFYLMPDSGYFQVVRGSGPWSSPFLSLLTSLLPPIAAGVLAAFLVRVLRQLLRGNAASLSIAGAGGTLAEAALLLLLVAVNRGESRDLMLKAFRFNGPFEVLLAALVCGGLGTLLYRRFIAND